MCVCAGARVVVVVVVCVCDPDGIVGRGLVAAFFSMSYCVFVTTKNR